MRSWPAAPRWSLAGQIVALQIAIIIVVVTAGSALALVQSFRPDLILVDLYMPDIDGMAFTARVRDMPGTVLMPIVFISGEQDLATRVVAINVGADDFLIKPVRPAHLIDVVVGRGFAFGIDVQIQICAQIGIGSFRRSRRRGFEGKRLLRLQDRLGKPGIAARNAGDRVFLGQVIKTRRALRARTLGAPFRLDHKNPHMRRPAKGGRKNIWPLKALTTTQTRCRPARLS